MFASRDHLLRCLDAIAAQNASADIEVLVPHDDRFERPGELTSRDARIQLVALTGRRTPAELRAAAVAASRAPVVALVEDHCIPVGNWCARILETHREPYAAVGGSVEKGFPPGRFDDSALNWAVYLTDYSRYMLPLQAGVTHSLTDCNVSYKRAELDVIRDLWSVEFHENVVNAALRAAGRTLWLDPNIIVHEQRDLGLSAALRDRYTFGRLFGRTRLAGAPSARRLTWAAGALLMPPVLVFRVARNLWKRRRHQRQLVRCLPALLFVSTAWMVGEAAGYLTGTSESPLTGSPKHSSTESA